MGLTKGMVRIMADLDVSVLSCLARKLLAAKASEEKSKQNRIILEGKIAAMVDCPERGSKTITTEEGNKVTIERGFNYKADCLGIQSAFFDAGIKYAPVKSKTTSELDEKGYEWIRKNDPTAWGLLSGLVVASPKKTSVSVKVKNG